MTGSLKGMKKLFDKQERIGHVPLDRHKLHILKGSEYVMKPGFMLLFFSESWLVFCCCDKTL